MEDNRMKINIETFEELFERIRVDPKDCIYHEETDKFVRGYMLPGSGFYFPPYCCDDCMKRADDSVTGSWPTNHIQWGNKLTSEFMEQNRCPFYG